MNAVGKHTLDIITNCKPEIVIMILIALVTSNNSADLQICAVLSLLLQHTIYGIKDLRKEFSFWNVHGIMNTSGILQCK